MDYKEDLQIIREKYPNKAVWYCFKYGKRFIFLLSGNDSIVPGDTESCYIFVERQTGLCFSFNIFEATRKDPNGMESAMKNLIFIDAAKEDLARI